jgi:hypothetical protein
MTEKKILTVVWAALALVVVGLWAYKVESRDDAMERFKAQTWGEVPDAPKVFALKPGQWMRFGPFTPAGNNIRYDLSSTAAVTTGLVASGGSWPKTATCYEPQVFSTVKSCTVNASAQEWIFVADSRTAGDVVSGAILGNRQAVADSKVTLTTYHWGCVSNCVK